MCSASWLIHPEGFELYFNRDESLRRGLARAPELVVLEGVRCLAPTDPDGGGTWLGVNEFGLALALLNAWDERVDLGALRSRGLLVRALLAARDQAGVLRGLAREPIESYRAFTLALFRPGAEPLVQDWDGHELRASAARLPLCSSSLDRGRAQTERARVFRRLVGEREVLDGATLERFQRSHEPERGPWSPCMHRTDAATVSASQVRVDARSITMRYAAGPPCTTEFGPWLELPRAPVTADGAR